MKVTGKVYLVGAGAGSFWYLTEYARFLLERADVVVYDRLIDHRVLLFTRRDAELISAGKTPETPPAKQEDINYLLVLKAREGKMVVRLKGGDPFVFGRGGEEAVYLATHGIPFEVIPGISSIHVAASRAFLPLTFRGISQSFHVFSGHPEEALASLPWELIAQLPGTLVFLMGSSTLHIIATELIKAGKDPQTPSCLVGWAGSSRQQIVFGHLGNIAQCKEEKRIQSPMVIFIGETASVGRDLWREQRLPSSPKRVMFVGSEEVLKKEKWTNEEVLSCEKEGIEILPMPLLQAVPNRKVFEDFLRNLKTFDTVLFASPNAVSSFLTYFQEGQDLRILHGMHLWAIGRKTAEALAAWGLRASYVASGSAATLLEETAHFPPHRVAIITSDRGGQNLKEPLLQRGWFAEIFPVYSVQYATRFFSVLLEELEAGLDLLIFLSPSAYDAFSLATGGWIPPCPIWAMGQTTTSHLQKKGIFPHRVVTSPAFEDILEEVLQWHRNS